VGVLFYLEYQKEVVLIDSFSVPSDLEQRGLNSHVIANDIADEISLMRRYATDVKTTRFSPTFNESFPDLEIPETKLSLNFVIQYLKETLGRAPTRINGEIVSSDKAILLNVRILTSNGEMVESNVESFRGEMKDFKTLISRATQFIMKHEDPYILARYQYNINELDQALDTVRYAAFHNPSDTAYHKEHDYWTYVLWGSILDDKGDTAGALKKFETAVEIDSQNATAYIDWGYALERSKNLPEALAKYQFACAFQNKDAAYGCNNWGAILSTQAKQDDAMVKYQEALRLDPELALAYVNISRLLQAKGDKAGAVDQLEKAIAVDPLFADAYNEWGLLLADDNQIPRAIEMFRKAIEVNSNYALAYNNLGYVFESQGKRDEAIKNYQIAVEKDPFYETAYLNWGNVLLSQRQYDAALEKYKKAAELPSASSMGYHNWGSVLFWNKNKIADAIDKFHKAIDLDPKNKLAYTSWATALRRKKDYVAAIEVYQKAFNIVPDYLDAINDWADLLIQTKDYNGAVEKCKFIIAKDQQYVWAYLKLGAALKGQGAYGEAIVAYQKVIELNSDNKFVRLARRETSLLQRKLGRAK
jgi:tetratricopeptide (TPR) repeat protein